MIYYNNISPIKIKLIIISIIKIELYCSFTCGATVATAHVGQMQVSEQTSPIWLQTNCSRVSDDLKYKT